MNEERACPIWDSDACVEQGDGDFELVDSPRTDGTYCLTGRARLLVESCDERTRARLTTWMCDQRRLGEHHPRVDEPTIQSAKERPALKVLERADRLLQYIDQHTPSIGRPFKFSWSPGDRLWRMLARTECTEDDELKYLARFLENQGWLEKRGEPGDSSEYTLTVEGYSRLSALEHRTVLSRRAFVAMWFDQSMKEAWEGGIKAGIEEAGYEAVRIDQKEHVNKIDDEIIAEIRRSRFVVADFTQGDGGPRGGVYYEAGFAHGIDIPVIFTCRKDALEKVHFDTRQYNYIVWEVPEELRERVRARISAVIGDGPGAE